VAKCSSVVGILQATFEKTFEKNNMKERSFTKKKKSEHDRAVCGGRVREQTVDPKYPHTHSIEDAIWAPKDPFDGKFWTRKD